jgi:hypothetical protein
MNRKANALAKAKELQLIAQSNIVAAYTLLANCTAKTSKTLTDKK